MFPSVWRLLQPSWICMHSPCLICTIRPLWIVGFSQEFWRILIHNVGNLPARAICFIGLRLSYSNGMRFHMNLNMSPKLMSFFHCEVHCTLSIPPKLMCWFPMHHLSVSSVKNPYYLVTFSILSFSNSFNPKRLLFSL